MPNFPPWSLSLQRRVGKHEPSRSVYLSVASETNPLLLLLLSIWFIEKGSDCHQFLPFPPVIHGRLILPDPQTCPGALRSELLENCSLLPNTVSSRLSSTLCYYGHWNSSPYFGESMWNSSLESYCRGQRIAKELPLVFREALHISLRQRPVISRNWGVSLVSRGPWTCKRHEIELRGYYIRD